MYGVVSHVQGLLIIPFDIGLFLVKEEIRPQLHGFGPAANCLLKAYKSLLKFLGNLWNLQRDSHVALAVGSSETIAGGLSSVTRIKSDCESALAFLNRDLGILSASIAREQDEEKLVLLVSSMNEFFVAQKQVTMSDYRVLTLLGKEMAIKRRIRHSGCCHLESAVCSVMEKSGHVFYPEISSFFTFYLIIYCFVFLQIIPNVGNNILELTPNDWVTSGHSMANLRSRSGEMSDWPPESSSSVELIHRDSPKSPFFDPAETPSQRLTNAFIRSINRKNLLTISTAKSLMASPNQPQSTVLPNSGEYLMDISIGTPPFRLLVIVDTGSDLTWTQCKPCTKCYNQTAPLFDPSSSKSYKNLPCMSSTCMDITRGFCPKKPSLCPYTVNYGDRSYTKGCLATDTLTLASTAGGPVSFPGFILGCGKDNGGSFDKRGSGIMGLGRGQESLVSQLNSSIGGKFSYCLVPIFTEGSSKMNFGSKAMVSGPGSVSTPLVTDFFPFNFYYLTMKGISVGNTRFNRTDEGETIIDSGTTLTIIPSDLYSDLESALVKEIDAKRVSDPSGILSLCYKSPESEGDFNAPTITVHFRGADVKLSALNTFVRVSQDVVCFAFYGDDTGNTSIYGNLSQMNFLVGYDNQKNTVSFKPTDCSKM
ncbi:hypothetical protein TIFTF001_017752 [Ficus carica]|uniref:Peptidase A1 domain-containing protein n=1 Tax=Ficus carica TaxID=3494 RepID=A0AA88A9V1_FICCA|nr:hypothetical protein TIFTF001_017752 [Ficus carica]